ncbi:hypothetical protein SAMN04515618_1084 [Collimonas sp. OK307]|uniref:hypothetical protein n=1 Tax=Collimonas sp. OK307 TaxID=1801620 RepID=UPI0008E0ABC8|nr:hypothetical protein [Collimonas sp. OK307]SFI02004.1 hypothetical protein SAMN04515618_1084 [Collimonas sp. OK307]
MLRLWNKPVQMVVEPHQVTALMLTAGQRQDDVIVPVAKPDGAAGAYDGIGKAIRDILPQLTGRAERSVYGICRLNVEVADTLVHYDVLKVDARRLPPAELDHLAALGMADTLGIDAGSLVMRCSVQLDGLSAVVCGMPAALSDAIKLGSDDAGCRLNRLEPGFAAFWNGSFAHSKNNSALLARLRGSSLMLGWLQDGKWQALATERLSGNDWAALSDSCDAFCRRLCVPDHSGLPIYFDADIADIPTAARNRWQRLPPQPEMAAAADRVSDFASNVA